MTEAESKEIEIKKADDKKYKIEAELSGLNKEDINISIIDDVLEIEREGKKKFKKEKEGFTRREYKSSSYFRRFKLPDNVDENKIDVNLKNGRLQISIPKLETEKKEKRTIEIK